MLVKIKSMKRTAQDILDAIRTLQQEGEPTTQDNIISIVECSRTTVWRRLKQLEKHGHIESVNRGPYGKVYKLNESRRF